MNQSLQDSSLTLYVTTPPEVYFLNHTSFNYCSIKIDWLSISGKFHAEQHYTKLKENHWRQVKELDGHPLMFELDRVNENGEFKQIATLVRSKYKRNHWKIDTSNHLQTAQEKQCISNITALFDLPHITRLDIAIDFINCEHAGMNYKIFKPNTTTTIHYNKAGKIEIAYYGKRKSNIQYRYYDKQLERIQNKKDLPNNIKSWERLELQLRSNKTASNWYNEALKMLNYFKRPNLITIAEKDPKVFFMLAGILKYPEKFNDLAKGTKAKYRKMIKNNYGFDTSLAELATNILKSNAEKLQQEISLFFKDSAITSRPHKITATQKSNVTAKSGLDEGKAKTSHDSASKTKADQASAQPANQNKEHTNYIAYDGYNLDYQLNTLIDILNEQTGKNYIANPRLKPILEKRLKEGFTLYDFEQAINYLLQQKRTISVKKLLIHISKYLNKINSN